MYNEKNSQALKEYLASEMAEIDAMNFEDKTYEEHYNGLMQWRDFDVLAYWLKYNGVFDGGEHMLNKIKMLMNGSHTLKN